MNTLKIKQFLTVLMFSSISCYASTEVLIDDFSSGDIQLTACGHNVFNLNADPNILGGLRELNARDGHSCVLGGRARITVEQNTAAFFGRTACELTVQYGSAIGTVDTPWSPSPNKGAGIALDLNLTLSNEILIDVVQLPADGGGIGITLNTSSGAFGYWYPLTSVGTAAIPLSNFTGLTETAASDIDGVIFRAGTCPGNNISDALIVDSIRINTVDPDSDDDGVLDSQDFCPETTQGALVNEFGCSGAQLVLVSCPVTASYKSHGQYVSCVSKAAEQVWQEGLIDEDEKDQIIEQAAKSDIGKRNKS
ncbi:hypothetical protein [Pseudoalteromonas sp.]|uniref:hypothetical protein n=1 Tax=Pseudoalteromonas sp. TaxID=53249 RepID=UPI00356860B8